VAGAIVMYWAVERVVSEAQGIFVVGLGGDRVWFEFAWTGRDFAVEPGLTGVFRAYR